MLRHFADPPSSVSLTQKIPNLDLTIYEKEDGIGGTWYVNRYPVSDPLSVNPLYAHFSPFVLRAWVVIYPHMLCVPARSILSCASTS